MKSLRGAVSASAVLLLFMASILAFAAPRAGADESSARELLRYAPEDTVGVFQIEVGKLLASKAVKTAIGEKTPLQYLVARAFDFHEDEGARLAWESSAFPRLIEDVLQHTDRIQFLAVNPEPVFIIEGAYNGDQLSAEIKKAIGAYRVGWYGKHEIISAIDKPTGVCVVSDHIIVFGEIRHAKDLKNANIRQSLERVIDRVDGKAAPSPDPKLLAALARLTSGHTVVGGIVEYRPAPQTQPAFPATQPAFPTTQPAIPATQPMEVTRIMTGIMDFDDQQVYGIWTTDFPTENEAKDAEQIFPRMFHNMARSFGHGPRATAAFNLLDEAKCRRIGKQFIVEMAVPSALAGDVLAFMVKPTELDPDIELSGLRDDPRGIAYSPDGKLLAAVDGDNDLEVIVWDTATRLPVLKQMVKTRSFGSWDRARNGMTLSFDSTSQLLAISPSERPSFDGFPVRVEGEVVIFDLVAKREIKRFDGRNGVFSPDGKHFAFNALDGIVVVDARSWEKVSLFRLTENANLPPPTTLPTTFPAVPRARLACLEFSPDGKLIAAFVVDKGSVNLFIWNVRTGDRDETLAATNTAGAFAWRPDSAALAIALYPGSVRIYDRTAHRETRAIEVFDDEINSIGYCLGGKQIAATGSRGMLRIINLENDHILQLCAPRRSYYYSVAQSPVSPFVAVPGRNRVYIWRVPEK